MSQCGPRLQQLQPAVNSHKEVLIAKDAVWEHLFPFRIFLLIKSLTIFSICAKMSPILGMEASMEINWYDWILYDHDVFGMRGFEREIMRASEIPEIAWKGDSVIGTDDEAKSELLFLLKSKLFLWLLNSDIPVYSSDEVGIDYIGSIKGVFTAFKATLDPDLKMTAHEDAVAKEIQSNGGKYYLVHNPYRDLETVINDKEGERNGKVRGTVRQSRTPKKS